ncbi:MAG TPA: hypothetical protein VGL15_02115 [Vicinamibacteria bacterium]
MAALAGGCSPRRIESSLGRPPTAEELARLWVEPKDLEQRDLFHGVGGAELAPDPGAAYRYFKKKTSGKSPGYTVIDPKGLKWSVKLGPEAQSEVAVSRLLWAIGFHQPPVYVLANWTLADGPTPGPQQGPGRFRPELPDWHEAGEWSWYRNPFVGTQPFRGLIVFMRIVNNWDLLDRNNLVYHVTHAPEGPRRLYVVKDLGASLGKTKLFPHQGTKNVVDDFEEQEFIGGVEGGVVRFEDAGRRHRELYDGIAVADVRWTSALLARLAAKQWQDAFRAAGYDEPTAQRFIRKLQQKVAKGLALS